MQKNTVLAITEPSTGSPLTIKRASELAAKLSANLRVCLTMSKREFALQKDLDTFEISSNNMHEWEHWLNQKIEEYSQGFTIEDIQSEVIISDQWRDTVMHRIMDHGIDYVVRDNRYHSRFPHSMLEASDWKMLRLLPCPIVLVQEQMAYRGTPIVAAIDLSADDDGHLRLNNRVLHHARKCAAAYGCPYYVVSAVDDDDPLNRLELHPNDHLMAHQSGEARHHFVAQRLQIDSKYLMLKQGKADQVILDSCREWQAGLLIMGTMARVGIKDALIGNTAESVLNQTDVDVMITT